MSKLKLKARVAIIGLDAVGLNVLYHLKQLTSSSSDLANLLLSNIKGIINGVPPYTPIILDKYINRR